MRQYSSVISSHPVCGIQLWPPWDADVPSELSVQVEFQMALSVRHTKMWGLSAEERSGLKQS